MDQALIIFADLFEIGPEALLDIEIGAVECAEIIAMLRGHHFAKIRFDESDAMLECALEIGSAAEEIDFVGGELVLPAGAPFDPVGAGVFHLRFIRAILFASVVNLIMQ